MSGWTVFETAVGSCGAAWSDTGLMGLNLPEGSAAGTRGRMRRRWPKLAESSPPEEVAEALATIVDLLEGRPADLSSIVVDLDGVTALEQRIYRAARTIPPGQTRTYGEVARLAGPPVTAQAVGKALARNPVAIVVPCHRVVATGGGTGGFSARGGVDTKLRMLAIEGATVGHARLFADDGPRRLGELGFDPAVAVAYLRRADPELGAAMDDCGPFALRLERSPTSFLALAQAIVYQQLHARAAATIFDRVATLCDGPRPERVLEVSDDELRQAGLSRSKLAALRDLAERAVDGRLPSLRQLHALDDAEVIERLTAVRGIGPWTADMFLIFRLGRPDVLPLGDYGVRQGFALAFGRPDLPTPAELIERGERWRPYRTVASWYLWALLDRSRMTVVS